MLIYTFFSGDLYSTEDYSVHVIFFSEFTSR